VIREAIEKIVSLAPQRPALLKAEDGSRRLWLYNDKTSQYEPRDPSPVKIDRTVSDIDSLLRVIMEDLRRRNNPTGTFATVLLDRTGGTFFPDDRTSLDVYRYRRTTSALFNAFKASLDAGRRHGDFLRLLSSLRPALNPQTLSAFRRVDFDSSSTIQSAPLLEEGKAGFSYAINFTDRGSNGTAALPSEIDFLMPWTPKDPPSLLTALLAVTAPEEAGKRSLLFTLQCPDLAPWEEARIQKEAEYLKGCLTAEQLDRVLVIENY
jgi:hypothetical protein